MIHRIDDEIVEADADEGRGRDDLPRRATIDRSIYSCAQVRVEVALAAAGVDALSVARIEGHGADRERRHLIGSRGPGAPRHPWFPRCHRSRIRTKRCFTLPGSTAMLETRPITSTRLVP